MTRLSFGRLCAPVIAIGCGGESATGPNDSNPEGPGLPPITVVTKTTGERLDANGYRIVIDGISSKPIGVNESVTLTGLGGSHTIGLQGLARNCVVPGAGIGGGPGWAALRAITADDRPAKIEFNVICRLTGTIRLVVKSTGEHLPGLYLMTISNHPMWLLEAPVNGTLIIPDVSAGGHTLRLAVPTNCRLVTAPSAANVPADNVLEANASVECQ